MLQDFFVVRASCAFALGAFLLFACSRPGANTSPASSAVSTPSAAEPEASSSSAPAPAVSAPVAGGAQVAANTPAVYAQGTRQISAKPGARFSVLLPASIGTPMKWRIDPAPESAVLSVLGESYADAPPADCSDCTGYSGTRRFDFEAKNPGKTVLNFEYRPLTEPKGPSEKQVHIDVSVAP